MRNFKIPKEKSVLLNNLTKMIENKIGIDNYLITEQNVATKYGVDIDEVILKEKEAILLEPEDNVKLRRVKILNNLYTKGLNYYKESEGGIKSDFTDALILNQKGELLFLLRKKDSKIAPNQYCLPGGHLEKFMSQETNVLKEIKEETNLDIIDFKFVATKNINGGKNKIYYFLCIAPVDSEVTLNQDEHSNYKWMGLKEIQDTPSEQFIFDLKEYILKKLLGIKNK